MIRKIFLIAGENFSGWHRNVRIWLTFSLGLVLCLMLSEQMLSRAQTYESPVQMFEPFIWTFGNGQSVLLSTLLLLILFADMPFLTRRPLTGLYAWSAGSGLRDRCCMWLSL